MEKRYKVRVLDESVTTHGFWVRVKGIELGQYRKNPVVLYDHYWGKVIGKAVDVWVEEKKTGDELWAELEFDSADTNEHTQELLGKIERQFIRMVSAGLRPLEWSENKKDLKQGQTRQTVTRSKLHEISVVVFGANENAFIRFYDHENQAIELSSDGLSDIPILSVTKTKEEMELKELQKQLGLSAGSSEADILSAIETLQKERTKQEKEVAKLKTALTKQEEALAEAEKEKTKLAAAHEKLASEQKAWMEQRAKELVDEHVKRGAVYEIQRATYERLAQEDYAKTEKELLELPSKPKFFPKGSPQDEELSALEQEMKKL